MRMPRLVLAGQVNKEAIPLTSHLNVKEVRTLQLWVVCGVIDTYIKHLRYHVVRHISCRHSMRAHPLSIAMTRTNFARHQHSQV